ncbi:hypothetical protein ACFFRR_010652 [Megaselia abdita]
MRPFSSLKIRYIDKNMKESERRTIFNKMKESKYTESSNFEAYPDISLVFFKKQIDVVKILKMKPPLGVLLSVHLDEYSKTLDPQMLILTTKPSGLKEHVKRDVEECDGEIVERTEEDNGEFSYICDFRSFQKCAVAYEKLNFYYIITFKKITRQDTWKFDVINNMLDNISPSEKRPISTSSAKEICQLLLPPPPPPLSQPPLPKEVISVPPPPPISYKPINQERRFKFYIKVQNDIISISKLDNFVHELEGYKSSWIMDSKCDPKWRYVKVEFDTDENTEDAYNLMHLFPVETKIHYFLDFLK